MKHAVHLCIVLIALRASAQSDSINTLGTVAASVTPGVIVYSALYQNYVDFWKSSDRSSFHFSEDPPYTMHSDKAGHAYYTYLGTDLIAVGYREAGVNRKTAIWLGAGITLLAQTFVEIGDGFRTGAPYFGFSPGDQIANVLGAALAVGKEYEPELKRIDFKMGFWTSQAYKDGAFASILDDNESRYFWLSFNCLDLLSDAMPKWLNLGIGFGVENIVTESYVYERRNRKPAMLWYIGPDINLKGLPIEGKVWKVIAEVLDHIRIPIPGLQFTPDLKWQWLAH
jgi:hypothetical protein